MFIEKVIIHLTYIYNAIVRLTYFPILWKLSQIIMFANPEKSPDIPTSYRPISPLTFFLKICGKLIFKRMLPHILSNNILHSF